MHVCSRDGGRRTYRRGLEFVVLICETVATVVKRCAPVAKDVAEEVADFAKCVPVVSSVF